MAIDVMNAANQSTLKVVTYTQDQFLKAYKTVASKMPSSVTPSWMQPDREAIEKAFAFQSELLEARKSFALSLLDAASSDDDSLEETTATTKK
jgi:hypothetical protein